MHIYVIYVLTNGHWILGIGMVVSEIYKKFQMPNQAILSNLGIK